jgi:multidrug resistance efflux pump
VRDCKPSRDIAALDLSRTEMRSTVNGYVTNLNLKNGDYAAQGKSVLAVIDSDGPSLLSNVNPNFTWMRLAQRIPIRIHLTYVPPGVLISAGMTCIAIVKQDQQLRIGAGVKRLLSALL